MSVTLQAIRGMKDILPDETPHWQALEDTARNVLNSYGYQEIRMPMLEKTELFARSIGDVTDIVEKEMYTFDDRNGDSLTLRPEGTAGCVRSGIENGLLYNQIQRLWYMGPMFRHERPQKERYRQFYQIGVEAFGMQGPDIDAELILLTARLWKLLGLSNVELQINSLGDSNSRNQHKKILVEYFTDFHEQLDDDCRRRLHSNPLRILDSKNPDLQKLINNAPSLFSYLDAESIDHFESLKQILDAAEVSYIVNKRLVRGLDYYCKTVFEWVSQDLGAQGTICAGGRYDGLVSQLGGKPTPAAGFAMGLERLLALVNSQVSENSLPHAYLILAGENMATPGLVLAEKLRSEIPELRLITNCSGGSMKSQFKKADKIGAKLALIMGADEHESTTISIKFLREDKTQITIKQTELIELLSSYTSS